jgi:hypothetical protein
LEYGALLEEINREVPPDFPKLAQNRAFLDLLNGFSNVQQVREKLRQLSTRAWEDPAEAGRILIIYSRTDGAAYAQRLYDQLLDRFGASRLLMDVDAFDVRSRIPDINYLGVTPLPAVGYLGFPPTPDLNLAVTPPPSAGSISKTEMMVKSASVVIAVIGPQWKGPWLQDPDSILRKQLALALTVPDIRVIPVLVDGAAMLASSELPEDLASLARRNALKLSENRWKHDFQLLADTIDYWIAGTQSQRLWNMNLYLQQEADTFKAVSEVLKLRHDVVKRSISDIR